MRNEITTAVEQHYAAVARGEAAAAAAPVEDVARSIGYSEEELALAGDANLGLGCGNPLALAELVPGMTVLDLGSGAGFDGLRRLAASVRRCQNDDRHARSAHPPLRHHRDRQRQLALQEPRITHRSPFTARQDRLCSAM